LSSIVVNGKDEALREGDTVSAQQERLGLGARYALVERNGEPVERARYSEVRLEDGDRLVVARPVAGG
jgi:thiamine biosynthesis protein ThiS